MVVAPLAMAKDLDAALEALKKKSKRQVCSTSAALDDLRLEVPKGQSASDRALEDKILALEKREASESSLVSQQGMPRPRRRSVSRPTENKNWLTPSMMDDSGDETSPFRESKPSWVTEEMDRQKENKALKIETDRVSREVREELETSRSVTLSPLKKYETQPNHLLRSEPAEKSLSLRPFTPSEFSTKTKEIQRRSASPTFTTAPRSRTVPKETYSPSSPSSISPLPGTKSPKTSSPFNYSWDAPTVEPLSPLNRVKRSSSIRRTDPFSEDQAPKIRTSIWD